VRRVRGCPHRSLAERRSPPPERTCRRVAADNEFVSGAGLGSVTVVLGGRTGLSSTAFALPFPVNEMLYGPPQTGDLNRDGIPGLVLNTVEAPYVLSGSTSLATAHAMRRLSPPDTEQLNVQAALVGDVNGDGRLDVTTPYISAFTDWKTALAVYFRSAAGLQPPQRGFGGDDVQTETTRLGGQIRVWLGAGIPFAVRDTISQDTGTVPGGGEADDRFGGTLAVGDVDVDVDGRADVLTGGVGEDIGTTADTGSVWIVYGGATTLGSDHDQMFSQSTAGVPGTATAGG
jgi:hypothetical protein